MADKSKDTGTGGINVDGNVYTPDVGVPDAKGGAQGNYSSGDIAVDKTVKDISTPTRETFAKYLSKTTLGTAGSSPHKNVYPVGAGAQTQVEEIKLKDTQGNPVSPGPQNNEAKFNAGFNQQISSNNPAGLRRGAATGTGPDGNALLPNAAIAAASGGSYIKPAGALNAPIAAYTNTTVEPNLYDYDSVKVGIADGTLNASPTQVRDIKALPASSDVGTDGGTSKNILGTDGPDGNYTLTAIEARALAGATTAKNKFPIDSVPTLVTFRDAGGNPVSVTAAQNNVTNAKFFTKLIEETGEGDQTVQTISVRKLSSYTDALTSATDNLVIKRGKTENANGIDGNDLLLTIAPETAGVASLTAGAKKYTDNVVEPNLFDFTTLKVIIGDGANILATNIRPYQKTKDFATDKGTSVNVFDLNKSTSVETEAELIATKTKDAGNAYPVDSPIVGTGTAAKLNVVKLNSAAVLANSSNANIFGSINIGSSTVISKGKLINKSGTPAIGLPDGNKLLANIAPFDATTKKSILTAGASTYITAVLKPNLHNYDTSPIGLSAGSIGESPTNPRENLKYIPADSSISVDGGKSINILGPDATATPDYTLTLIDRASYAETITKTNFFKVDAPSIVAGVLIPKKIVLSTPLSVTDAQNNPFASFFFTKEKQTINGVDKVVSKLESSYTDALAASRGATDKFIIKRGKTENANGIDGNALLSTIAPKINDKVTLTPGAKTYITAVLEPNLNDIYNPKTESGVVIPEYENDGAPSGIKDLNKTSTFALDAGTSKTILSGERKLSLENAAAVPSIKTKDNFYPVDSLKINIVESKPVATLTIINTSVDKLAKTNNTKYFADIAIGSNATINSKGKLKNKDSQNKDLPNGNTLLPLASTTGSAGGNYVKFVTSNTAGSTGLQQSIKTYTSNVVEPNLYDYNTLPIGLSAGSIGELPTNSRENLKYIPPDASISVDGGSSTNILGPGGGGKDYTLTLIDRATQASKVTVNNSFKVDLPNTEIVNGIKTLKPKKLTEITPDSVTDAQNHPFASSFFTKGIQIINDVSKVVSKLESSYTDALAASRNAEVAATDKFIIKRGKTENAGGIDGNALLSTIAPESILGVVKLTPGAKTYTTIVLDANLYNPLDSQTPLDDKSVVDVGDFFGPRNLYKPLKGLEDAGTFDNIQKDPSKRAITQASLFKHVIDEVAGKNAPGNIGNVYKLSNLSSKDLFSFTTPEGVPASPTAAQNNIVSLTQYVLPAGTGGAKFVKLQPSYSNATEKLEIRRGKSIRDERPDGNTLLKDAAAAGPAGSYIKKSGDVSPTISKYVGAVLGENRYSPQDRQQFVPSDTPGAEGVSIDGADPSPGGQRFENISDKGAPETSFVGRTTLYAPSQLKFGESPQSMVNRGEPPTGYTFRRLTRIGTILQLRAAGEATFLAGDQNDDPRSQDHQFAAAFIPGAGQAGAGVPLPRELLNVTEIIKNLPDLDEKKIEAYENELIDFNSSFEGVINTALEKFSGFTSFGLSILAIVLVAVIVLVFKGLTLALGNSAALDRRAVMPAYKAKANSAGIHGLGSFKGAAMGGGTNFIADLINAFTSIPPSGATALFGISPTYNREYSEAVTRGALAFFGVGSMPPPLLSFPGQVIVTSRAIIRGVAQLVKAFIDMGLAFASGNIMAAIFNLIGIIEVIRNSKVIKALNTFSQIGDSGPFTILGKSYKKITQPEASKNVFAGDETISVTGNKELYDTTNNQFDIGIKISEIDSVDDTNYKHKMIAPVAAPGAQPDAQLTGEKFINKNYIGLSQVKSRLRDSTALAWSTYRAPSLFVTMKDLGFSPDDDSTPKFNINTPNAATYADPGPRISSTKVKAFEDALDGEYMPFYFQDLRTNEIIGLHAFLTSLSDDYSANYESVSGIGRAEPVRIYKDTQRKIGLSFMLAALDKNDFDHMWDKVNRLTMLVYPQYTAGKLYNGGSGIKFEKPFTQQVGASPMVRLRLGNLLRSNYSKFNLARIFGIGSANTKVDLTAAEATAKVKTEKDTADAKQIALVESTKERIRKTYDSVPAFNYVTDYTYKFSKVQVYYTQLDEKTKKSLGTIDETAFAAFAGTIVRQLTGPTNKAVASARFVNGGTWFRTLDGDKDTGLRFKLKGKFGTPDGIVKYAQGIMVSSDAYVDVDVPDPNVLFYVPVADLVLDDESANLRKNEIEKKVSENAEVEAVVKAGPAPTPAAPVTSIAEFMSADKNVIVKSFESTGGKGLAGFIDSINFDWYDRTTWDIEIDRKAPKMCKVTISFTPIHDISPGLDVHGNNRAPIYPLGPYAYGTRKGA